MRSKHFETYKLGSFWVATTIHPDSTWRVTGETEAEALGKLADDLQDTLDGLANTVEEYV